MPESDGSAEIKYVRSSFSGGGNCVEVGTDPASGHIAVRQSRNPDGPALLFSQTEWRAFLHGVHDGQFGLDRLTE